MPKLSEMNVVLTFHVSLSFENDEGITPTATILVTNDPYTLDRPKALKFTPEVALGRGFWLERISVRRIQKDGKEHDKPGGR